jgi:hypothetical protein
MTKAKLLFFDDVRVLNMRASSSKRRELLSRELPEKTQHVALCC